MPKDWSGWATNWPSTTGDGEVKFRACILRLTFLLGLAMVLEANGIAANVNPSTLTPHRKTRAVTENQHAKKRMRSLARSRTPHAQSAGTHATATRLSTTRYTSTRLPSKRHHYYERFHTSSFATDIAEGDVTAGEDPVVRQAAIDALGNMNGTVVAIEPTSGRVLAMVNQKLALSSGAQP